MFLAYFLALIMLRDLSLMVKYETFNLCYMGSNPIGLKLKINFKLYVYLNDHSLMVEHLSSKQVVSIRIRLVVNL